jgi:DNA polymerase-1
VTLRLWHALRPGCGRTSAGAVRAGGAPADPVLLEMERAGVKVDADDLRRMSVDFERAHGGDGAGLATAGGAFQRRQPKQLGEVLFDEMKLPGGKRMKTGAWGTDSSVLQALADQGHELPARILEWRQLQS